MSFAGTLENIDALDDSPTPTATTSSPGRALGRPWSVVITEPQIMADSSVEVAGASGLSYLASASLSGLDSASRPAVSTRFSPVKTAWPPSPSCRLRSPPAGFRSMSCWAVPICRPRPTLAVSSRSPCWFHRPRRRWRWLPRCGPYRQSLRRRRLGLRRRRRRPTITTQRRKPRRPGSSS